MASLPPNLVPVAYQGGSASVPDWLNKGDNAWQMISATLVGLQSVPGLVILYGSIVKKKWAVNSAFMALYAFAAVVLMQNHVWKQMKNASRDESPITGSYMEASITQIHYA